MPIPTVQSPTERGTPAATVSPAAVRHGPDRFDPAALVLAFVFPGLGHWYLGERKRAYLIAAGILGLFVGGVFIGGVDAVDKKEDTIWFAGQALVGPLAFGVDYVHQNVLKVKVRGPNGQDMVRSAWPNEVRGPDGRPMTAQAGQGPPNSKSLGRMNELGTLFATIAGMLNLLVIIDAAMHGKRE
jgi:hypothetical protein